MIFASDASREMWSTLALVGSLAVMFTYGAFRREHTRVWPILMAGILLDIATQVWFVSRPDAAPGVYTGLLLYPMYCTVATVAGIMSRVGVESWICRGHSSAVSKS